jgi:hypothetical protein
MSLNTLPTIPNHLTDINCSNTAITIVPRLPLCYFWYQNCSNLLLKPNKDEDHIEYISRWHKWWDEDDSKKRCQERNKIIKEDLIAEMWKPERLEKMLDQGGWDLVDSY